MRFEATVEAEADGTYVASCENPQWCSHGLSPASALDTLHGEICYRIELCPCTGVSDDFVELDVVSGL